MSETVSTGATSAPSQGSSGAQAQTTAPTSSQSQSTQGQQQSFGQSTSTPKGKGQPSGGFDAQSGGQAVENAPPAPRKLGSTDMDALVEVTIDGKTQEMTLKEVLKLQSLEKASRQRMSEAQRERAEAQKLMQLAKSDPERYMREVLGVDPKGWAEERLAREYELSQMSPEARRAMELEQQLQAVQEREARTREPILNDLKNYVTPEVYEQILAEAPNATIEQLQSFAQAKRAEFQAGIDQTANELLDAWQKTGLPRQKYFGRRIAQALVDHEKKSNEQKKRTGEGLPPLQPSEAAVKVKAEFQRELREMLGNMDAPATQEFLGEEILKKLRAHDVERVSTPQTPPWTPAAQTTSYQPDSKKPYMNEIEYRKWLKGG